jgi:hypothetical protein
MVYEICNVLAFRSDISKESLLFGRLLDLVRGAVAVAVLVVVRRR